MEHLTSKARLLLAGAALSGLLAVAIIACGPDVPQTPAPEATVAVAAAPQQAEATAPPSDTAAPLPEPSASPTPPPTLVAPTTTPGVAAAGTHETVATPSAAATTTPGVATAETHETAATPSPAATTTVDAFESPTAAREAVASLISGLADEAWGFLVNLTENFSPRASATEEEKVAADFLLSEFQALGLQTRLQPFTVELLATEPPALSLNTEEPPAVQAFPLFFSGQGTATGGLVDVGKAFAEDMPPGGLSGEIALIRRGEITFEEKVTRVAEAGALAAVVYNNVPGGFGGRLANQADIPAIAISLESGVAIKELMGAGDVEATVSVVLETRDSRNVIAERPGTDEGAGIVVIGAHYDTVPDTQGANDNGSGVSTLLALAREISDRDYPFTIRYVTFGSEEVGLFGSRFYVDSLSAEERGEIIAMLNFDVPGSGEFVEVIGSPGLVGEALEYGAEQDLEVRRGVPLEGASSDHAPFREAGVPVVFILADDLSRINSPADDIEFVERELMGISAALGIALLDGLAAP